MAVTYDGSQFMAKRQVPHGPGIAGIDREQCAEARLGDPLFGGDLRPPPPLIHAHQQSPCLDEFLVSCVGCR